MPQKSAALAPTGEAEQPFRHAQEIHGLSDAEERRDDEHAASCALEEPGDAVDLVSFPAAAVKLFIIRIIT